MSRKPKARAPPGTEERDKEQNSPYEHAANKEQPGGVWGALGKEDVYAEYSRCVEDTEQKACGRSPERVLPNSQGLRVWASASDWHGNGNR